MTVPLRPSSEIDVINAEVGGHRIEVLVDGALRLDRLLSMIDGAQSSISIIMYIFEHDGAGRRVLAALLAAAERGVLVRMVIDSFGSSDLPNDALAPLRKAGGQVTFFSRRWRSSYLIRNHQKLVLVDDQTALTGGFNIADDYLSNENSRCWFDLGISIRGPATMHIARWFETLHDYTVTNDGKLLILRKIIREWPVDDGAVSWLVGGPTQRLSPWARAVRRDLDAAREADMAMAYFSPGQGMLRRLGRVAARGRARFVMAGKSDNAATIGASRLLYGYLLRKGAEIWEYRPCRLHMKLIVIDDVVYIGTANFDVRSLFVNVEAMLRIADAGFAATMRDFIARMQPASRVVTRTGHKASASWLTRLRWALAWFVVGAVDYTVSRRLNFGLGEPDLEIE